MDTIDKYVMDGRPEPMSIGFDETNKTLVIFNHYFDDKSSRFSHLIEDMGQYANKPLYLYTEYAEDGIEIGTFLTNFVNIDFSNFDSFKRYFTQYGLSGLINRYDKANIEIVRVYTSEQYEEIMNNIWINTKDYLVEAQSCFKFAIEYCFCADEKKKCLFELTPIERFFVLQNSNYLMSNNYDYHKYNLTYYSYFLEAKLRLKTMDEGIDNLRVSMSESEMAKELKRTRRRKKSIFPYVYSFESYDITNICFIDFIQVLMNNVSIKKCDCCKIYFIPINKKDEKYCSTCRKFAAQQKQKNKISNTPSLREYTKAYKRNYARRMANKLNAEEFLNWTDKAKTKIRDVDEGKITLEEFKEWLKQ